MLETLETLLNIQSPTGDTAAGIEFCKSEFEAYGMTTRLTPKGALIASFIGTDPTQALTLSAHVDTLGAMVKAITPQGTLRLSQLGGYAWATIEGSYVSVNTRTASYRGTILLDQASSHVHGAKTNSETRAAHNLAVRLDEKVRSQSDVEALGIKPGDFVHFDPNVEITDSGFIKSRHLDDKACIYTLFELAKRLQGATLKHSLHFFISNYEEVGHGAAAGIPKDTTELLVLDMAAMGDTQTSDEFSVTICAKDSSGPYDLTMRHTLEDLAVKHNIPYQTDIYPYYGSDGSAAWGAGALFPVALIGPGVDASHSFERTHVEAINATTDLAFAYIQSFNERRF